LRELSGARDDARRHAAARGELALDLDEPRRAVGHEPLEHLVHDLLLEDLPLAERRQVVAERLQLVELRAGYVADRELAEVGRIGERTDRGELRRPELHEVVALLEPVLDRLEQGDSGGEDADDVANRDGTAVERLALFVGKIELDDLLDPA